MTKTIPFLNRGITNKVVSKPIPFETGVFSPVGIEGVQGVGSEIPAFICTYG